jgi:hypothetical protein
LSTPGSAQDLRDGKHGQMDLTVLGGTEYRWARVKSLVSCHISTPTLGRFVTYGEKIPRPLDNLVECLACELEQMNGALRAGGTPMETAVP